LRQAAIERNNWTAFDEQDTSQSGSGMEMKSLEAMTDEELAAELGQ
jgi:hypothetical protein